MPIVEVSLSSLKDFFPKHSLAEIESSLPSIGLDIEGKSDKFIRLEYNPNRPDFSSCYGIFRALKGYLGVETGLPRYRIYGNKLFQIRISRSIKTIRPYLRALVAKGNVLDRDHIKDLIEMQEDLHIGICNGRKKASIGLHSLKQIRFPLKYTSSGRDLSFIPLDLNRKIPLKEILISTDVGKKYSYILNKLKQYPILLDSENEVVSFPPIVNANSTRLDHNSGGIFIEVTAIDSNIADLILAIYASTLSDMGFTIHSVNLNEADGISTRSPDMRASFISASFTEINKCLGTKFSKNEIVQAIRRSRLGIKKIDDDVITCLVPRYRNDLKQSRDLIEEVMIGIGISKLSPTLPLVNVSGGRNMTSIYFDIIRDVLIGLGLLEIKNFGIISRHLQFDSMGIKPDDESSIVKIENSIVSGNDLLRDSLLPSLINTLSHNIHAIYPQGVFEIGKVFKNGSNKTEKWHLCVAIAHSKADYTCIKSILQAFLKSAFGKNVTTENSYNGMYAAGRTAVINIDGINIGEIGEISDIARHGHRIRVPVAAFEMDLSLFVSASLNRQFQDNVT
jgi:phenylalanyl-tRNA synthetase beta chain